MARARFLKAKRRMGKLRILLKLNKNGRRLYRTNIWPCTSFGSGSMGVAPTSVNALRTHAAAAALGKAGQCGSSAIAIAFPMGTDPAVKVRVEIIGQWLRTWLSSSDDEKLQIRREWPRNIHRLNHKARWSMVYGPLRAAIATLLDLGWSPVAPDHWKEPGDDGLWWQFTGLGDFKRFHDAVARTAMAPLWRKAAEHMSGKGMENGADFFILKKHLLHYQKKGMDDCHQALQVIAAGACWPRTRKLEAGLLGSATCVRCGHPAEDDTHFFWGCEKNSELRPKEVCKTQYLCGRALASQNKAFWNRGIVTPSMYPVLPEPSDDPDVFLLGSNAAFSKAHRFFLDGSGGEQSSDPRLRRTGWGAAVVDTTVPGVPELVAGVFGPVPGPEHTVPRSELYAAVYVLESVELDTDIHLISDSKYFVDKACRRRPDSFLAGHGDLWDRYWNAVENREGNVRISKVKAHATQEDLDRGVVSWDWYAGNAMADKLAVEGASRAALPAAIIMEFQATDSMAWQVQSRLTAIICEGPTREKDHADAIAHKAERRRLAFMLAEQNPENPDVGPQDLELDPAEQLEQDLGPPEIPERLGGSKSQPLHLSHSLEHKRGIIWCSVCGAYAVTRGRKLLKECRGRSRFGDVALDRIRKGLTPHNSVSWTV